MQHFISDAKWDTRKDWCNNAECCKEAGIPEHERHYRTKPELAHEIILHQIELCSDFDFVSADGLDVEKWVKIKVRNTCKGALIAHYKVFIWKREVAVF